MSDQVPAIVNFMIDAFLHIWPYLLVTIPLAVAVRVSGASRYIGRAFQARPLVAIFLATAVGAFSPFCSCSVIPVVATLLIGGVPLAPVMSFWIASPSMDPEIFFLSVPMLGWELAVARLAATLTLSLSAGLLTHLAIQRGWLGETILKTDQPTTVQSGWSLLKAGWYRLKADLKASTSPILSFSAGRAQPVSEPACCDAVNIGFTERWQPALASPAPSVSGCGCDGDVGDSCAIEEPVSFRQRLFEETWRATVMVAKFMALAFLLEALIILYVPSEWIAGLLGSHNRWAIINAALIGVPVYTTELTALPMVSGLLARGMNSGAALAFLIAGPTTTLPAMAAVWGLVTRRVFVLYLLFSLVGAIGLGYLFSLLTTLASW